MCESTPDSSQNPVTQHEEGDEVEVVKPSTPSGDNAYVLAIYIYIDGLCRSIKVKFEPIWCTYIRFSLFVLECIGLRCSFHCPVAIETVVHKSVSQTVLVRQNGPVRTDDVRQEMVLPRAHETLRVRWLKSKRSLLPEDKVFTRSFHPYTWG